MTGDPNLFIDLHSLNGGKVSFGENTKGKIIGKGTVEIGELTISDVSW